MSTYEPPDEFTPTIQIVGGAVIGALAVGAVIAAVVWWWLR